MRITGQVTELCVDDFALRKGTTYGTIFIDSKSHRVIDLIPSREKKEVAEKLAEYPNLKVVSRDGPPTYAAAITEADPEIMQVSDRFHLLKGLAEACKYVIQGLFKANIAIQKPGSQAGKMSEYNSSYWEKEVGKDAGQKKHEKNPAKKRGADLLERKWLVKLLYKPKEQSEGLDKELIGRLLDEYPIVQDSYGLAGSFKEILFSKKAEDMDNWLAEGSVNKLKLVKRKMYGRCSFETLRKKVLLQEQYKIVQQT